MSDCLSSAPGNVFRKRYPLDVSEYVAFARVYSIYRRRVSSFFKSCFSILRKKSYEVLISQGPFVKNMFRKYLKAFIKMIRSSESALYSSLHIYIALHKHPFRGSSVCSSICLPSLERSLSSFFKPTIVADISTYYSAKSIFEERPISFVSIIQQVLFKTGMAFGTLMCCHG